MPHAKMNKLLARADAPFEIKLESPGATGYEWKAIYDPGALALLGRRHIPNMKRMGASGEEVFRFRPLSQGKYEILFSLSRPWETRCVEQMKYAVHVK